MTAAKAGPFDGLRVIDFGRYIAGPYCAALLGDLGADVIRVEKREGREDRTLVPLHEREDGSPSEGAMFLQMNRAIEANGIKPVIDTVVPFESALDAWRLQASGNFIGKIVVSL